MKQTRKSRAGTRLNRLIETLTSLSTNPDFVCVVVLVLLLIATVLVEVSK